MSRQTATPLTGHAVVHLKNGTTYVGRAEYDDARRAVTIDGSLRVIELVGGASIFTYRKAKRRTVQWHLVREIVWDDEG
jgi:hypothetical protein